ncbi:bolA-like protein DDB_G0274169 [Bacillus rossius redtenbacheri]|uniref:bolA-like protein DDB_G0274169 n=1 Tax=Bacillus rossius redtenbacheri TaxID=93214 RepID=UPI002FDD1CA4
MLVTLLKLGRLSSLHPTMSAAINKPVETEIRRLLTDTLKPSHLDVINESHKHNVPKEAEMHFKVVVVSDQFEGKKLIERHRMVNTALHQLLEEKIHALSIEAKTPAQWQESSAVQPTPPCEGGFGK